MRIPFPFSFVYFLSNSLVFVYFYRRCVLCVCLSCFIFRYHKKSKKKNLVDLKKEIEILLFWLRIVSVMKKIVPRE